jgi:hypothetical protein
MRRGGGRRKNKTGRSEGPERKLAYEISLEERYDGDRLPLLLLLRLDGLLGPPRRDESRDL